MLCNTNSACWASLLLNLRTVAELDERRSVHSGRPLTRAEAGFISKRWTTSIRDALSFLEAKHEILVDMFDRGKCLGDGTPVSPEDLLSRL